MEKVQQHEQQPDEVTVPVTIRETTLISNIIYAALKYMTVLDDDQRKIAQHFIVKLQKAALSIHLPDK